MTLHDPYPTFTFKKTPEENLKLCQDAMKAAVTQTEQNLINKLYLNYTKTLPYHIRLLEQANKQAQATQKNDDECSKIEFAVTK